MATHVGDRLDRLRNAISAFERILDSSVEVRCVTNTGTLEHRVLSLEIRGMLWCVPHRQFLFRTDIDLESGHMDHAVGGL